MARANRSDLRLDSPKGLRTAALGRKRTRDRNRPSSDRFGRFTEAIARGMGTPWFLLGLTFFAVGWIVSFLVAIIAIKGFIKIVSSRGFTGFGVYRVVFGLFLFWFIYR